MPSSTEEATAREVIVAADAVARTDVTALPNELGILADALRSAGDAQEASAKRVVPPMQSLEDDICSRYQRAAARWPVSPPPPHERFAAALASLHEAADAARLAAHRCERARRMVQALLTDPR